MILLAFRFEAAFSEYLAARANVYAPIGEDTDEAIEQRGRREHIAEAALISTPAPYVWAIPVQI